MLVSFFKIIKALTVLSARASGFPVGLYSTYAIISYSILNVKRVFIHSFFFMG